MTQNGLDLPAYLARIGWTGPLSPDLHTLRGLIARHTDTVPFENLDIVMGRPIPLDLPALQRKLVDNRRGGYCFEHSTLFQAVLGAIGFDVAPLLGRVVMGQPPDAPAPRTHMVLRIALPEGDFLADVGFGRLAPTGPLAFGTEAPQATPNETYRLVPMGAEILLQAHTGAGWRGCYRLSPEPAFAVDIDMGNWFTATRPGGLFTTHLVAARPIDGGRATLFNGRVTVRRADGSTADRRDLRGADDYRAALAEVFGLTLPASDLAAVAAAGDRLAQAGLTHPSFG